MANPDDLANTDLIQQIREFHVFCHKEKFIAILPQKLGVDLICICTCYITHRMSGYRVKDALKWKIRHKQTNKQTQTQLKSARIVPQRVETINILDI